MAPAILRLKRAAKIFRDDKALTVFNSQETYEKSSSATVCRGARCRLFCSGTSFGLLLPWAILPIFLPRALLPIPLSRALLSAPGLGGRLLPLLVNGLTVGEIMQVSPSRQAFILAKIFCNRIGTPARLLLRQRLERTPSHLAAVARSVNKATSSGE